MDEKKKERFNIRLQDDLSAMMLCNMAWIGVELDLFKILASKPTWTIQELATASKCNERYIKEWLCAMSCSEWIEYNKEQQTFTFPIEHQDLFIEREGNAAYRAGVFESIRLFSSGAPSILNCFKNGGGLKQNEIHPNIYKAVENLTKSAQLYWVPDFIEKKFPDLHEKLSAGITVSDVGCGVGNGLIGLGTKYPNSKFTGYEPDEPSFYRAKANLLESKLKNVEVICATSSEIADNSVDFVMTWDVIHDVNDPESIVKDIHRALKPGGIYLMNEVPASSQFENNLDRAHTFIYCISVLYCLTLSLSAGGPGYGACMGSDAPKHMCENAKFSSIEVVNDAGLHIKATMQEVYSLSPEFVSVTIFDDTATVTERRLLTLKQECSEVYFQNIPAKARNVFITPVDITAVTITSQSEKKSNNFTSDVLVSSGSTLLAGNIISKTGNSINLYVKETSSVAIIPIAEDTTILPIYDGMKDERESELISFHTTYITTVKTSTPNAEYLFDVVYSLSSLSWRANYSVIISEAENAFHFSGKYTITNSSNHVFKNAQVTLVSSSKPPEEKKSQNKPYYKLKKASNNNSFNKRKSSDYSNQPPTNDKLYTFSINHPLDIPLNDTTISFAHGKTEPINKHYLLEFQVPTKYHQLDKEESSSNYFANANTLQVLEIQNMKERGLGLRLPKGPISIFYSNSLKENSQFQNSIVDRFFVPVTEDSELIRISLKQEGSISGTKTKDRFTKDDAKKLITETFTLTITNSTNDIITTMVEDTLYRWNNWKVTTTSGEFHPNGKDKIRWLVTVAPAQTENIQYTVQYSWDDIHV